MLTLYWIHLPEQDDPAKEGYVGITSNFERRMKQHKRKASNQYLQNVINKYGWDNLIKEIIVSGPDDDVIDLEQVFRPKEEIGWNICIGGETPSGGMSGHRHSEEAKQKIREANIGKTPSEEVRQKLSEAKLGKSRKPFTEETKQKIRDARAAQAPFSEEARKKMSDAAKLRCARKKEAL